MIQIIYIHNINTKTFYSTRNDVTKNANIKWHYLNAKFAVSNSTICLRAQHWEYYILYPCACANCKNGERSSKRTDSNMGIEFVRASQDATRSDN